MKAFLSSSAKYLLVLAAFVVLVVLNYFVWSREHSQEEQIKLLQEELNMQYEKNEKIEGINAELKETITNLKVGSHEMIEEEARKDFGMVREGETYFTTDEDSPTETDHK